MCKSLKRTSTRSWAESFRSRVRRRAPPHPLYVVAVEAAMRTAPVLEMRARRRERRNPRSALCRMDVGAGDK